MIRLYEYEPRTYEEGNTIEAYRDFPNFLFSYPYGFLFDFVKDKVTIHGTAYRLSSLQRVPDAAQLTCVCVCGGEGSSGTGGKPLKLVTDVSLQGEGNEALPLGIQLSKKEGNRLQVLEDGVYVGGEPLPYAPPSVVLSSSIAPGNFLKGESLSNMVLTVVVTAGSESIRDVRIFNGSKTLHVFDNVLAGSNTYTHSLTTAVDEDATFKASTSDGTDVFSNVLQYRFLLPIYCGVSDGMQVEPAKILETTAKKVTGSSFEHVYEKFDKQHLWMACPENRVIKSIMDENGFPVTSAFVKTAVKVKIAGNETNYTLYCFDTKTTGANYKIIFNF